MRRSACLTALTLAGCALASAPKGVPDVNEPRLNRLLAMVEPDPVLYGVGAPPSVRGETAAAHRERYFRLLDALGEDVQPNALPYLRRREPSDLAAKLSLIAYDRHLHPELHRRIVLRYLQPPSRPETVSGVPGLAPEDLRAEARLAWESLLLVPRGPDTAAGHLENALGALARIGDSASVLTMMLLARNAMSYPLERAAEVSGTHRLVLQTLLQIPGVRSADAILELETMARTLRSRGYPLPPDWIEVYLTENAGYLSPAQARAWLAIASRRARQQPLMADFERALVAHANP